MKFAKSKAFKTCCVLMIALTLMAQQPVTVSSGTVTANAGTNLNTSALALDATVSTVDTDVKSNITLHAGTNVIGHVIADSGSTTAVTGNVAVTKADGSDVTLGAKADAKSTATDTTAVTAMQVLKEISAMEQAPASRAVTNAGTFADQATLQTQTDTTMVGGVNIKEINAVAPLMGNGITGTGSQRVTIASDNTAFAVNATLSAETTKVIGTVRAQGNLGAAFDAATGAAPPANGVQVFGLCSGATGGLVCAIPVSDTPKAINISTATTTLVVTGVSGRQVRIGSYTLVTGAADNVAFIEGTGATCGTGTAGMTGGTTAASGLNFSANGGTAIGSGLGTILQTATAGDSVCLVTSAAVQLSGNLMYAIY